MIGSENSEALLSVRLEARGFGMSVGTVRDGDF
jgi:hypothetical protein